MPRKRHYKKRKTKKGAGLQKNTIYNLTALALLIGSILSAVSFSRSGNTLLSINDILVSYFGFFSFLIPVNLFLFGLVLFRMKNKLTRPNVWVGFFVFTVAVLGLFKSGGIGAQLFFNASSLLGAPVAYIIMIAAVFVGFVVVLNISFQQLFSGIVHGLQSGADILKKNIFPLFKIRKEKGSGDLQSLKIKGYKDQKNHDEEPIRESQPVPPVMDQPRIAPKVVAPEILETGEEAPDILVSNNPLKMGAWEYPPLSLLSTYKDVKKDTGDVKKTASKIENTLQSFGVKARVVEINVGPSVTQYAIEIALGTKLSKITGLSNDLALATEAPTGQIRIEAPIPGRSLVGIEIPNRSLDMVGLKSMLESPLIQKASSKLAIPLGLNISGKPVVAEINKMPHVLIAGTTGSGKSVLMNAIIASILFRASPAEVRMIMIDPKRVEFTGYNDLPHLLSPVVVEVQQAVSALKWALKVMDARYIEFAKHGVRNIEGYNEMAGFQRLPYIVILIDELADLMALASVEVEDSIARLAQMARATGIHLVLATQRPSVDVITGLIKANIPCRISFSVSSMIDSKVIIDSPGAEKLLGKGDMLYVPPDQAKPTRIQGTFVADQDVKRVTNFIKSRGIPVEYTSEVTEQVVSFKRGGATGGASGAGGDGKDDIFTDAIRLISQHDKISVSMLQRKFSIGFNRAAKLMEQLEEVNAVGPADGSKPRDVRVRDADSFIAQINGQQ